MLLLFYIFLRYIAQEHSSGASDGASLPLLIKTARNYLVFAHYETWQL
jgi:hypothetical protein